MASWRQAQLLILLVAFVQGARALDGSIPTFTYASPQLPTTWNYTAPADESVIWFEAQTVVNNVVVAPTPADYVTNGGQILDVFAAGPANTYNIRGYVPASDPFASNTTLIQLSDSACNLAVACSGAAAADNAPVCNVYAVDMAYCGTEGLVTDRSQALLVLVCSEPVSGLCSPNVDTCIEVTGPANHTVDYTDLVDATDAYYHTLISWNTDYLGAVGITFNCPLTDANGNPLASPIQTINFSVTSAVAVRSTAYKIGNNVLNVGSNSGGSGDGGALLPNPRDRPAR